MAWCTRRTLMLPCMSFLTGVNATEPRTSGLTSQTVAAVKPMVKLTYQTRWRETRRPRGSPMLQLHCRWRHRRVRRRRTSSKYRTRSHRGRMRASWYPWFCSELNSCKFNSRVFPTSALQDAPPQPRLLWRAGPCFCRPEALGLPRGRPS